MNLEQYNTCSSKQFLFLNKKVQLYDKLGDMINFAKSILSNSKVTKHLEKNYHSAYFEGNEKYFTKQIDLSLNKFLILKSQ